MRHSNVAVHVGSPLRCPCQDSTDSLDVRACGRFTKRQGMASFQARTDCTCNFANVEWRKRNVLTTFCGIGHRILACESALGVPARPRRATPATQAGLMSASHQALLLARWTTFHSCHGSALKGNKTAQRKAQTQQDEKKRSVPACLRTCARPPDKRAR